MVASGRFTTSAKPARIAKDRSVRAAAVRQIALDDGVLVHRFNSGDESAFIEIMTRHHDKIFSLAFSVLRNRSDAEEIVQDTFISARRGLARFRGDSSLVTWLHQIALNLARNRYWYFFRRGRHTTCSFDSGLGDNKARTLADLIASDDASPADEAAISEFLELITLCMGRLGPGDRDILARRNLRNGSYNQIAQSLGISTGTVKSRIARARAGLRVLLAKACPDFAFDSSPSEWFFPVTPSGRLEVLRT